MNKWKEVDIRENTMNNSVYLDKNRLHQAEDYSRAYLPKLVADATFQHTSERSVPRRLSKSEECSKINSLGNVHKQRSFSTSLISLPHLFSYRELVSDQSNPVTSYPTTSNIHGDAETSDQSENEDESDEGVHNISIDPYPNVGVESFLNSYTFQEAPPTPPRRRKRKEIKLKNKQENETKNRQKRNKVKTGRPKRWSRHDRIRERELARKHPVRKQFLYSEIMEEELKSIIPKRIPGGKLKPIYKRTSQGDIYVPNYPLNINLERLNVRENEDIPLTGTATDINKFRKQELREMLEKRKKLQLQRLKKRQKRVRFALPSCHVDSEESDSENQSYLTSRGSPSVCSQTAAVGEYDYELHVTTEETKQVLQLVHEDITSPIELNNFECNNVTDDRTPLESVDFPLISGPKGSTLDANNIPDVEERDTNSAMLRLPAIKDGKAADQTEDDTITIVDSIRFRISKANGNTIKYTRIDS